MRISLAELQKRAVRLNARLSLCDICPRKCGVNRLVGERSYCHSAGSPIVASYCVHRGEEPAISGTRGSGTIFLGNCNLRCVFCQNYQISQDWQKQEANAVSIEKLADIMLELQSRDCHNINLVSPSHFVPQIVSALALAVPRGLNLPLVYNTNAYDNVETLRELDGIIDIYLPDIKYSDDEKAVLYSSASDYTATCREAIKEMWKQVGALVVDEDEVARRGTIMRHLILPNNIAGSRESLNWLSEEVSNDVTVSMMSQYQPMYRASLFPEISRTITTEEYDEAMRAFEYSGIENGWAQEPDAPETYIPDFGKEGHPFEK